MVVLPHALRFLHDRLLEFAFSIELHLQLVVLLDGEQRNCNRNNIRVCFTIISRKRKKTPTSGHITMLCILTAVTCTCVHTLTPLELVDGLLMFLETQFKPKYFLFFEL